MTITEATALDDLAVAQQQLDDLEAAMGTGQQIDSADWADARHRLELAQRRVDIGRDLDAQAAERARRQAVLDIVAELQDGGLHQLAVDTLTEMEAAQRHYARMVELSRQYEQRIADAFTRLWRLSPAPAEGSVTADVLGDGSVTLEWQGTTGRGPHAVTLDDGHRWVNDPIPRKGDHLALAVAGTTSVKKIYGEQALYRPERVLRDRAR